MIILKICILLFIGWAARSIYGLIPRKSRSAGNQAKQDLEYTGGERVEAKLERIGF